MDPISERPSPSPIGNQETGNIYNKEHFRVLLERAVDEATILENPLSFLESPLSLFMLQPLGDEVNQDGLEKLAQIITKQTKPDNLKGRLEGNTFGIAFPRTGTVKALQIVSEILDKSPVPLTVGHSIFSIRYDERGHKITDRMVDLYDAAESALSEALKPTEEGRIVTLLRHGQELYKSQLPKDIRDKVILVHK